MSELGQVKVYEEGTVPNEGSIGHSTDWYCPVCGEFSGHFLPLQWRGEDGLWRKAHFCVNHRISDLPEDMR